MRISLILIYSIGCWVMGYGYWVAYRSHCERIAKALRTHNYILSRSAADANDSHYHSGNTNDSHYKVPFQLHMNPVANANDSHLDLAA